MPIPFRSSGFALIVTAAALVLAAHIGLGPAMAHMLRPIRQSSLSSDDAAAKAAARKKKFEEETRRLEGGQSDSGEVPSNPNQTFFVSPATVNMVIGQTQPFCAFDIEGKLLTGQAKWSVSDSYVAKLSAGTMPTITAMNHGTVTVRADAGGNSAEATITVVSGDTLAAGSVRWSAPGIPGYKTKKITPAVPHANGPDLYILEANGLGESLIRAFTSDGLQLWMRRSSTPVRGMVPH
jgi:Tfp pilus assembly protein PilX